MFKIVHNTILSVSHLLYCNKFRYNSRPNEKKKSFEKKLLILLKDFLVALILAKQSKKLILKF